MCICRCKCSECIEEATAEASFYSHESPQLSAVRHMNPDATRHDSVTQHSTTWTQWCYKWSTPLQDTVSGDERNPRTVCTDKITFLICCSHNHHEGVHSVIYLSCLYFRYTKTMCIQCLLFKQNFANHLFGGKRVYLYT